MPKSVDEILRDFINHGGVYRKEGDTLIDEKKFAQAKKELFEAVMGALPPSKASGEKSTVEERMSAWSHNRCRHAMQSVRPHKAIFGMKFIELFAGIGGFRYGLEQVNTLQRYRLGSTKEKAYDARFIQQESPTNMSLSNRATSQHDKGIAFECVWANEIDKYACQIYRKNFGEGELYEGNITKVKADDIPDADLLTAGFPCQAFSIAGKRRGFDDTRGTLFFEIARICRAKKPRYILLENVKGLLSHQSGQTFQTILKVLSDIGYVLQWEVLNSKNFGVPQNRERVFIVGHFRGTSRPEVFPISKSSQGNLAYSAGVISQREKWLKGEKDLSREFSQGQRIYSTKGIAQTLAGNAGGQGGKTGLYETNMKIRRLTPTECERLQGFPDGWTEGVSDTQRYKCLGNAVTTNVITEIGKKLFSEGEK
jgi:DNA (cytosine-5)-methyltransferase 1